MSEQTIIDRMTDAIYTEVPIGRRHARNCALAALKALRVPTGAMIGAGNAAGFKSTWRTVSADVFTAMVDAAIAEAERA
jgi:hypothetical protein